MGPKKAVPKEKESPVTFYGFDAELLTKLSEGYPRLVTQNEELVSKNEDLMNRDKTSKGLIKLLTTENKDLCSKVSALERDILEVKKKSDVDLVAQLSHDIETLETKLQEQEKYTSTAEVQCLIDQVNEAGRRTISDMEIKHGLEKEVIRLDLKNKGEIVVALQEQVHDLKAMNHLLNEALNSKLKKEAVKSDLKKDQPTDFRKDLRPETEEVLKRLAAKRKERRNGDGSSDNTHLTCSPMWGWGKGRMA